MSEYFAAEVNRGALEQPVPRLDLLRRQKATVNKPLDVRHHLHREPLVPISEYGLAGQSYYSRPNELFDVPVAGVSKEIMVRESIAETLAEVNASLAHRAITDFFQGEVELYIEEGVRLYDVQKHLYEEQIPQVIRAQFPHLTDTQVAARRDEVIALPTQNPSRPAPHASGGAVDLALRYVQQTPDFVEGSLVPMGREATDFSDRADPDFFERRRPATPEDYQAMRHRRALYAIMTGRALGFETHMTPNPTEFWHWDRGNHLWSVSTGQRPYYGLPPEASRD